MRAEWAIVALVVLGLPLAASADGPDGVAEPVPAPAGPPMAATPEVLAGVSLRRRGEPPESPPRQERPLVQSGEEVDASYALDEMLDEFAVDIARLGAARNSPILLDRVRVSENMNPEFAAVLEARIAAALQRGANAAVMRCAECWATRGRVERGEWVVSRGISTREDMRRLARTYGARTFLSASLSLYTSPDSLSLDVELVRDDGTIAYAEGFRVHPQTAMLYRGADSAQVREERLQQIEQRLNNKAQFGHGFIMGAQLLPYDDPEGPIWGGIGGYRLYEVFGDEREYRFGISLVGFLHSSKFAGAFVSLGIWARLTEENIHRSSLHLGGSAGALLTGSAGNTPFASINLEYVFGLRMALQLGLAYVMPFKFGGDGPELGGVSPQVGTGFLW